MARRFAWCLAGELHHADAAQTSITPAATGADGVRGSIVDASSTAGRSTASAGSIQSDLSAIGCPAAQARGGYRGGANGSASFQCGPDRHGRAGPRRRSQGRGDHREARRADRAARTRSASRSRAGAASSPRCSPPCSAWAASPPPAILVRPEDILTTIRTAILLGAVLPELRNRRERWRPTSPNSTRVRTSIAAERDTLAGQVASAGRRKRRLHGLVGARQGRSRRRRQASATSGPHAAELARQATSLKDLIARMESEVASARQGRPTRRAKPPRSSSARPPKPMPRASGQVAAGIFRDPARLQPAVAFADTKGLLPLPVDRPDRARRSAARTVTAVPRKGCRWRTRPRAVVSAPADGWVAFSGPYRTYGQLLIFNARRRLLYRAGRHGAGRCRAGPVRARGRTGRHRWATVRSRRRRRSRLARPSLFSMLSSEKTGPQSIPGPGGRRPHWKRFADDAQGFSGAGRRGLGAASATVGAPIRDFFVEPAARAAASDTYRDLNLFGDVFEQIRTDYVEKPDEQKLIQAAINGMLTSLDPHSSYMDAKSLPRHAGADARRVRRPRHRGHAGRRRHQGRLADRRHARLQGRHPVGRPDHRHRRRERRRADAQPGGRQDARRRSTPR